MSAIENNLLLILRNLCLSFPGYSFLLKYVNVCLHLVPYSHVARQATFTTIRLHVTWDWKNCARQNYNGTGSTDRQLDATAECPDPYGRNRARVSTVS